MKARTTSEVMLEQQLREIEEAFEEPECSEIAPAHIVTGPEDEVLEGEVVDEEKHENRSETSKSGSAHSTSRLPWLFPLTAEKLFEMARSTVDVNGKECFEMTGDIGGEAIAGILGDGLESMTGLSLDEETLADVKIPCTIDIYRESILPARFFIDMSDIIDTIVDVSSAGVSVSECSIEVTYLDFDSLDTIEVPREAVEATEDAGPDSYDDYEENIFGDLDAGADPIEPADSLGRVWETYTVQINDKVLSLPCSIEEMRAAGLEMDTEYTPDNYVVNAGDYELAWFEDADGNSVMADMVNMTSDPMEIRNCQVGGISVYDYDVESGALVVILPGGVQIGTHIDDVLSAYGDADDSYDGDYSNSYYWNGQGDNYYDGCSVDTDPETDRVISMSISHYE